MVSKTVFPGTFFKLGYVTADLARAQALFGEQFGMEEFLQMGHVALAYQGDVLIEIIQTSEEEGGIFPHLLSDSIVSLHHLGYMINTADEWAALNRMLDEQGIDVPMRMSPPGLDVDIAFIDMRAEHGYYLEFVLPSETTLEVWRQFPRYG